eukprot:768341-Hanusia_phi.AAC.4
MGRITALSERAGNLIDIVMALSDIILLQQQEEEEEGEQGDTYGVQAKRSRGVQRGKAKTGRRQRKETGKKRTKEAPWLGVFEDWSHHEKYPSLKGRWTEEQINQR